MSVTPGDAHDETRAGIVAIQLRIRTASEWFDEAGEQLLASEMHQCYRALDRLVARVAELERERDDAQAALEYFRDEVLDGALIETEAALARVRELEAVATAYLDRQQQMKGAVLTGGDFLLLAQAEDNLRAVLGSLPEATE